MGNDKERFGILLMPGFPMASVASALDVLALANYVAEDELYAWSTLSPDGQDVLSMNGLRSLVDHALTHAPEFDTVIVCCGLGGHRHKTPAVLSWLRERHARGTRVGATSTGSWLLARSGLLHGRRCTVHWEDLDAFRETFPDLRVTSEIFEVDGRIFTCSGGTSIIDLMLSFVATRHGADLATAVSEQLIHGPYRSKSTNQRPGIDERIGITDPMLVKAVATMEAELHSPLPVAQIAKMTGVSSRHLERLFRKHLGQTPQLFYRELRLRQARSLLRSSDLPVSDVAYSLGFSTPSYFAKCYFELFGLLPRDERSRLPLFEVIE